MQSMPDCNICCEKLNKSTRSEVKCEHSACDFSCCKSCARTYIIGTLDDPHCMKCKGAFSDKFLVENLNRSFFENEYKKHRKQMLVERELSKLPDTMEFAGNQKVLDEQQVIIKENKEKVAELKRQMRELKIVSAESYNIIHKINHGTFDNNKRQFIMSCPSDNCRGYLSTQYKCDLCKLYTCPTCLEIIGYNKTDPHTCNPDNIASAEMIKKDTKACPSCGVRIHRIEGCNQMWCTQCKIAFDYVTGRIDHTGNIHNYHYYQYLQEQQTNDPIPRNPHDILCGGLCSALDLNRQIIGKLNQALLEEEEDDNLKNIRKIHRTLSHITYYTLPRVRENVLEAEDNRMLRAAYILNKKSKDDMATQVYKKDNLRRKHTQLLHIYELISVVGIEMFATMCNSGSVHNVFMHECRSKLNELTELKTYCNRQFRKISHIYNNKVMFIENDWTLINKKY